MGLGQIGQGIGGATASAAVGSGNSLDGILSFLGSPTGISLGIGGLSALMGLFAGDSPQDEASKYALEQLKAFLPEAGKTPYSKGEVGSLVGQFKNAIGTSTDIAKTGIATSLAEGMGAAGVPQGQPQGSMYTSELAPLDANAVTQKAGMDKWGAEFWAGLDADAKNRVLQTLSTLAGTATTQSATTTGQEGMATFLQAFNLLSKGGGEIANMFKDINWKSIKP